jgi:hypothetical protein
MAYSLDAPDYWTPATADDPASILDADICVIAGQGFLVRGLIELPVVGTGQYFAWNVWVSLSETSFSLAMEAWDRPGRESEPPYFGWLSNEIAGYSPSTFNLKTNLHTRPIGERPLIELEPTDHPLAVEQRTGITEARVRQIAESSLHP